MFNRRPMVSVLSPVFNEAKYLPEMIDSLKQQSFGNWEALFVDDGSSDSTAALVARSARADSRVRLISTGSKLGKVGAFNAAFEAASGDIIILLAGDDKLPPDSLQSRASVLADNLKVPTVAFFKIQTLSELRRLNGIVLPRGRHASRSGGSLTMTRSLADLVFPIEHSLVAEDVWLGYAAEALASKIIEVPKIVLEYRIHPNNSNPRGLPFPQMTERIHQRHAAWRALLDCPRFSFDVATRSHLEKLWQAEVYRYTGRVFRLLTAPIPLVDRLGMAAAASPMLFAARKRFYGSLSGLRNK